MSQVKSHKYFILIGLFVALFSLLPYLAMLYLAGPAWQGILPDHTNDSLYYYDRMSDVGKGHLFIGNPYFVEHQAEYAPAFFGADWLAAWPLWLGLSLEQAVVFNYLFWPLILGLALVALFLTLGLTRAWALGGALVSYLSIHDLMSRPVVMQVIFPFYVFFLTALVRYLKAPLVKRNYWNLIFFYAMSFYLYSYLWQITTVSVALVLLWSLVTKQWLEVKSLFKLNLTTLLLILPVLVYTYFQVHSPYFLETMVRLGLVETHLPTLLAITNSILVGLGLVLFFGLNYWSQLNDQARLKNASRFFVISGGALIIANFSNLITGQEIEIASHIDRFIWLWLILLAVALGFFSRNYYRQFGNLSRHRQFMAVVLIGVFCLMTGTRLINFLPSLLTRVSDLNATKIKELQTVSKPLAWLDANALPGQVVWTDRPLSYYVPIRTHQYVLFSPGGGLHLMSSAELVDRYLVANYFRDLTLSDLKTDFRSYAGVGNAIHQYKTHNRQVQFCQWFQLNRLGYDCGQLTDSFAWRGEKYFLDLGKQFQLEIKPKINQKLDQYQVAYILIDKTQDQLKLPLKNITGLTLRYQDDRFAIYSRNPAV